MSYRNTFYRLRYKKHNYYKSYIERFCKEALKKSDIGRGYYSNKQDIFLRLYGSNSKTTTSVWTIEDVAFGSKNSTETICKKVQVKTGSYFNWIKYRVESSGYPEDRIGEY